MKTTAGKTKSPPRPLRPIQITHETRGLLAVVSAHSLKQGLIDYFESTLKGHGFTAPLYNGNMLTVKDRRGRNQHYIGTDCS